VVFSVGLMSSDRRPFPRVLVSLETVPFFNGFVLGHCGLFGRFDVVGHGVTPPAGLMSLDTVVFQSV
jgi:hypothetical protein